jgi:3-oxoacyl-[acyl-carrier protein] reductase
LEDFDQTLDTNLRPSFLLTKGFVPAMRAQKWGRIVFVSSIAAQGGGINGPHYAASKGGLTGLMRNLSTRLAEYNISVRQSIVLLIVGE